MARLLTVLGITDYQPVHYHLTAEPGRTHFTAYAPVATTALAGPVTDATVLLTSQARARHWEGFRTELAGLGIEPTSLDIPAGETEDEIWQIFGTVMDAVREREEVVLDLTHSFRHLPFVLFASLIYLTSLRSVTVRGIYYGAFEARAEGRAPIFDLTRVLTLAHWYHAVLSFAETGNPRGLVRLLREEQARLFELRGPDRALARLRGGLERLSWTLPSGLPLEAGLDARQAVSAIQGLLTGPPSPLVRSILDVLLERLSEVALAPEIAEKRAVKLDLSELDRQLRLARQYAERGQADRALLVLREWTINRCLLAAGVRDSSWLDYNTVRKPGELALNGLAERERVKGEAGARPRGELASLWASIAERRNPIAHAGFRPEEVRDSREAVGRLLDDCEALAGRQEVWQTAGAGGLGRVLLTPLGLSPGVLFTALRRLQPDQAIVVTSEEAASLVSEAQARAAWNGSLKAYRVRDAHGCFEEAHRLLEHARAMLLEAREVLANVTGGTTAMQYLVERVARDAGRLGIPTRRYALVDRRSMEEQLREPYVEGEVIELDKEEPRGDG